MRLQSKFAELCQIALVLSFIFSADAFEYRIPDQRVVFITMPHSGTHQLMKAWFLATGEIPMGYPFETSGKRYCWDHFNIQSYYYYNLLDAHVILNIRDPRDAIVRWALHTASVNGTTPEIEIMNFINSDSPFLPGGNMHIILDMIAQGKAFLCRFEKLIGEPGGGTNEAQREHLTDLFSFCGIILDNALYERIAFYLYGSQCACDDIPCKHAPLWDLSFVPGKKIGLWKDHFTKAHKIRFKERFGEALILLGYEKDCTW